MQKQIKKYVLNTIQKFTLQATGFRLSAHTNLGNVRCNESPKVFRHEIAERNFPSRSARCKPNKLLNQPPLGRSKTLHHRFANEIRQVRVGQKVQCNTELRRKLRLTL